MCIGHTIKSCAKTCKHYHCQGKNHHTVIYEISIVKTDKRDRKIVKVTNDNDKNDDKVARLIDARPEVLLQLADFIIPKPGETKTLNVKVSLELVIGSQKVYLSDGVLEYLQLDAIAKLNFSIKLFRNTQGQFNELGEFKIALRGFKNLKLADGGLHKGKMNLLIGVDFYCGAADQSSRRGNEVGPVALGLKLEW